MPKEIKRKEIKFDVELQCFECGRELEFSIDYLDEYMSISIEPCEHCLERARKDAKKS